MHIHRHHSRQDWGLTSRPHRSWMLYVLNRHISQLHLWKSSCWKIPQLKLCFIIQRPAMPSLLSNSPDQSWTYVSLHFVSIVCDRQHTALEGTPCVCVLGFCCALLHACSTLTQTLRWADRFMALQKRSLTEAGQPCPHQGHAPWERGNKLKHTEKRTESSARPKMCTPLLFPPFAAHPFQPCFHSAPVE